MYARKMCQMRQMRWEAMVQRDVLGLPAVRSVDMQVIVGIDTQRPARLTTTTTTMMMTARTHPDPGRACNGIPHKVRSGFTHDRTRSALQGELLRRGGSTSHRVAATTRMHTEVDESMAWHGDGEAEDRKQALTHVCVSPRNLSVVTSRRRVRQTSATQCIASGRGLAGVEN